MTYSWLQCTCVAPSYSLYMCYSVRVLSLHDCGLFIIHVLVYHVLSLHNCGLFIVHVLQCTCATVCMCYSVHVLQCACATVCMCSASMAVFYSLCLVSMGGMTVTDKPYQCSVCERAFIRKQDIGRHRCVTTR